MTPNALYGLGYGYTPSDGYADATTADVVGQMNALYAGPGGALRSLRNAIPESPNALSAMNMVRGGLGTAANWMQGRPEIGPDTLAPLGLAGFGMALAPRNALGAMGGGKAGGLDMSEAARMQRAKEMGFDTERTYYHGTAVPVNEFSKLHRGGVTGARSAKDATWLVDNPKVAEGYADLASGKQVADLIKRSERAERAGKWDEANRLIAEAERLEAQGGVGQNILPLRAGGRIKDVDMNGIKYDPDDVDMGGIVKAAKAEGYDGIRLTNFSDDATYGTYTPSTHVGIFDPRNIRSTQAAFDPAKRDSANLLASSPTASAPGLAANSQPSSTDTALTDILRRYGLME